MISRRHRAMNPRQLGAPTSPAAPPAPGSPAASFPSIFPSGPAGKAVLAGVAYVGVLALVFAAYQKLTEIQLLQENILRSRAARRRASAPRKRSSRSKAKQSILAEIFDAPDEGPEEIVLDKMRFYGGRWEVEENGTWIPFEHPGHKF